MSRIGRMPISVPAGVTVDIDGSDRHGQGPQGHAEPRRSPSPITVAEAEDGTLDGHPPERRARLRARCTA